MKKTCVTSILLFFVLGFISAQNKLNSSEKIPILAWSVQETTPERLQEIKDAGFTSFIAGGSPDEIQKLLDLSHKIGLKILITPSHQEIEKQVRRFMNHPALMGYHLADEPLEPAFAELTELAKKIRSIDDRHPSHVNLFPIMQITPED
jgi:hypothetical protein